MATTGRAATKAALFVPETFSVSSLPFLDLGAEGFSTRAPEVLAARARGWCAQTPRGYAVLRHREAGLLLRDRRLRQGSHSWPEAVGIDGSFATFWRRSIISQEGERHRTLRRIAQTALSEEFVLSLVPGFEASAAALEAALPGSAQFDFLEQFSEPFAGQAMTSLTDRPVGEATALARDASLLGQVMGPEARNHAADANAACDRLADWATARLAERPRTGYIGRLLVASEAAGLTDRQALIDLVVISIFGGVDTTRAQLAFALLLFAQHQEQWHWLRLHPEHIPAALDEVIRTRPTTTWATREALEQFDFGGVTFRPGDIVHILVHATGTDPATGAFGGFDIRAARKGHFGFGGGAHHCLGHFVARTDMAAALRVLLRCWTSVRIAEPPSFLPDSGNTAPTRLPLIVDRDAACQP